ncbi:uncharacterized protein LOC142523099 [Primulina tabacum]|uniref:uncharacterized protein LOC142523099 n=1 Tax=Primulina tabacum TaxID=48773 RepID=UPI003F599763
MELHRPAFGGYGSSIVRPTIQANTFELKPTIIQMIQLQVKFGGSPSEDPNAHLKNFLSICDTIKCNGVSTDAIRLRLFPFSLEGEAMEWLRDLPVGSITTWDGLIEVFMHRYFPSTKITQLRNEITSFRQRDEESLNSAWEKFKKMLRMCPRHGFSIGQQVETFYYGVDPFVRSMVHAAANGSLNRKTPTVAVEIISNITESNVGWQDNRREKKVGFLEMDALTTITAKLDGLTHQMARLQANKSIPVKSVNQIQGNAEIVGGSSSDMQFMPDMSCVGIQCFGGDSVNYVGNQGRQQYNPYSFSYNPGWRNHPNFGWRPSENSVEQPYFNPPQHPTQQRPPQQPPKPPQGTGPSMPPGFKPHDSKSNLEDMHATYIAGNEMRCDTEKNPKGVNAVTVTSPIKHEVVDVEKNVKEKGSSQQRSEDAREKEALAQMPSYAKFLKEILSNKRKLVDFETVKLSEKCSAILQNKLPSKLKDPSSFSIPCTIESSFFSKTWCDLGASINLMSYSCFEKLGIDFVVLDMEEDREIPLILCRPFLATGKALIDVHKGELVLRLNDESVVLNLFQSIKYPNDVSNCSRIDATDEFVECDMQELICEDSLEICLTHSCSGYLENKEIEEYIHYLEAGRPISKTVNSRIGELGHIPRPLKSSIEEAPIVEMKHLPSYLKYLFLLDNDKLSVIVSSTLTGTEEEKLLRVLRENIKAIGWSITNIKGISSSMCMHKVLMEADHKTSIQPQRRLNLAMQEVVKKEVIKLLDAGIIYPISDIRWVSPVQVVPKKGGITVVKNENNELIHTRTVTG